MEGYSIRHIYRSQNFQADILSKKGLLAQPGIWNMEVIFEIEIFPIQESLSLVHSIFSFKSPGMSFLFSILLYFCICHYFVLQVDNRSYIFWNFDDVAYSPPSSYCCVVSPYNVLCCIYDYWHIEDILDQSYLEYIVFKLGEPFSQL